MPQRGKLIILTGINGVGKDEQAARLTERVEQAGRHLENMHVLKSCPGVTAMRSLVLGEETHFSSKMAEALAFFSMHYESAEQVVKPLVSSGGVVLLNRGPETTFVYNILGNGLEDSSPELFSLYEGVMKILSPDLVILLDTSVAVAKERMVKQSETDGWQNSDTAAYELRRKHFLKLAEQPNWKIVDATPSIDEVSESIWALVQPILK
jgi:thymidylate kinase